MSVQQVIVGIVLAGIGLAAWPAPVGRVIVAAGITSAIRDGREIRLAYGTPIEAKDVLRTGTASMLQVHFIDDSIKSLRENSELAIEEFRFAGSEDGTENAVFRLIKGGFRAATGLIGRTRHANYSVRTSTATIGIRGTDFAVRDCRGDCGAGVKDGLYGSVLGMSQGTNKIALSNNAGEFVFGINQHFHVIDVNSVPQPLLQPPTFVAAKPQGGAKAVGQGGSGTGQEAPAAGSGAESESRPALVTETVTQVVTGVGQVVDAYQSTVDSTQPAPIPTTGAELVVAVAFPHDPGTSVSFSATSCSNCESLPGILTFESSGFGFKRFDCGSGCFFDRNTARSVEVQSVPGVIEWGKWIDGTITAGGDLNGVAFGPNQGLHYIVGVPTSLMPTSGTATFSLLGATTPTFSDGFGGGLGSGTMTAAIATANFLTGGVTANMSLAFSGSSGASNYSLAMTGGAFSPGSSLLAGTGSLNFIPGGAVNVCTSGCPAFFSGFFAGTNASHLGLGYDVAATTPSSTSLPGTTFAINGVAVMKR